MIGAVGMAVLLLVLMWPVCFVLIWASDRVARYLTDWWHQRALARLELQKQQLDLEIKEQELQNKILNS